MADFLDTGLVKQLESAHTLSDLHDLYESALSDFCSNWT